MMGWSIRKKRLKTFSFCLCWTCDVEAASLRRGARDGMLSVVQSLFKRDYVSGYSYCFLQTKWALAIIDHNTEPERMETFRPDYRLSKMFLPRFRELLTFQSRTRPSGTSCKCGRLSFSTSSSFTRSRVSRSRRQRSDNTPPYRTGDGSKA